MRGLTLARSLTPRTRTVFLWHTYSKYIGSLRAHVLIAGHAPLLWLVMRWVSNVESVEIMRREYKNTAEEAFCKFIEQMGYTPIKRGWPDFFCTTPDGKIMAVEVKPHAGEYLKVEQLIVGATLAEYGIPTYRWNPQTRQLQPIKKISELREMGSGLPTVRKDPAMPPTERNDRR